MTRLIDADALWNDIAAKAMVVSGRDLNKNEILDLITNAPAVQREVPESIKELIKNQQQLPDDMQKILYDNLFDLYESPAPLPVMPLTHEQLNTPFGTGRTVQREGWKLVPFRDDLITEEMKRALFINLIHADDEAYVIKAIIAAAPKE